MSFSRGLSALMIAVPLTAAWAQTSSVQISGFLDLGVYRDFAGMAQLGTIQRSNITFSGVEDLGVGLSTTFKLSHRLDLDTGLNEGFGQKPFWHGESTVGLRGDWGYAWLGRALSALWAHDWKFDPLAISTVWRPRPGTSGSITYLRTVSATTARRSLVARPMASSMTRPRSWASPCI